MARRSQPLPPPPPPPAKFSPFPPRSQGSKASGKGGRGAWQGGDHQLFSRDPQADAIREIKDQLRAQGGTGRVLIEGWQERFGPALGSFRDFVESRPDKFAVEARRGRGGLILSEVAPAARKRRRQPFEEEVEDEAFVEEDARPAKRRRVGGKGAALPALGDVPPAYPAGKGASGLAVPKHPLSSAIQEIKAQLNAQGGVGIVRIENWQERYAAELGPLKQFLLSRPDKFNVVPEGNGKFYVELVDLGGATSSRGRGKGNDVGRGQYLVNESRDFVSDAIRIIKQQLKEQGGSGKVRIEDWATTFAPRLGTLREFLESRPDKFTVHRAGRGFVASLVDGRANVAAPNRQERRLADRHPDDKVVIGDAIREIKECLWEQGGAGRVSVVDWDQRYGPVLGSLSAFIKSRPDKFEYLRGRGINAAIVGSADLADRGMSRVQRQSQRRMPGGGKLWRGVARVAGEAEPLAAMGRGRRGQAAGGRSNKLTMSVAGPAGRSRPPME